MNELTGRKRLPERRPSVTWRVMRPVSFTDPSAGEAAIYLSMGYELDTLEPRDVFYADGYKSGSELEALVTDACIIVSIALQHGLPPEAFQKSLSQRESADGTLHNA